MIGGERLPIDPADIRKGDLIRLERDQVSRPSAFEYRAHADRDESGWFKLGDRYYLLDRPKPPVELPTKPTWGLLEFTAGPNTLHAGQTRRVFAEWYPSVCISGYSRSVMPTQMHATDLGVQVPILKVTAFTPATAVPTAALDELRDAADGTERGLMLYVRTFLAAVDEANE